MRSAGDSSRSLAADRLRLAHSQIGSSEMLPSPPASMFAWARLPEQYREHGSMEFAKQLLVHAKIAVAPGIGFGEYGEGYVRIGLVENEHRIRQAARNVKKFLSLRLNEPPSLDTAK